MSNTVMHPSDYIVFFKFPTILICLFTFKQNENSVNVWDFQNSDRMFEEPDPRLDEANDVRELIG